MNVEIYPSKIDGEIFSPSSKSYAHRLIIGACLSKSGTIKNIGSSKDILATISCMQNLGYDVEVKSDKCTIKGYSKKDNVILNCGESGSTIRFLMPIVSALGISATFTGTEKLLSRPNDEIKRVLTLHGEKIDGYNFNGKISGGEFEIDGSISSQYITGLLFALPLLKEDSKIIIKGELVSKPYIDITIDVLKEFNIKIEETEYGYFVKGNQQYKNDLTLTTEGDFSGASFMLALGAINGKVTVKNLNINSKQGDKKIVEILQQFGAKIEVDKNKITTYKSDLKGAVIDMQDIPDLSQVVAVLGANAKGKTILKNIERLKLKECDRENAILNMLQKANIMATSNGKDIEIIGGKTCSNTFDSFNDHRQVMSATVLALSCQNKSIILEAEAVKKSYPNFFDDIEKLGGKINVNL